MLDIEPVEIELVEDYDSIRPKNCMAPVDTARHLKNATKKEHQGILKSGALGEVHHATPWS